MKSKEEIKKEMEVNREHFYRKTLCDLRKNNPILEEFMWKAIKTAKTRDFIQIKIVRLSLVVLRAVGATDKEDPDFVCVSKKTVEKMEKEEAWKKNIISGFSISADELISYVNRKINKEDGIRCEDALNRIKQLLTIFYLEKIGPQKNTLAKG